MANSRRPQSRKSTPQDKPLTARQVRFVEAYLEMPVATAAARRAGYKHPEQAGYQLLHEPRCANVQAAIKEAQGKRAEKVGLKAEDVVRELMRYAFAPKPGADLDGQDPEDVFQVAVEPKDRLKALELLGKHLKLFTEKLEVGGEGGGPLVVEIRNEGGG